MRILNPPTLVKKFDEITYWSTVTTGNHTGVNKGMSATEGANDWRPASAVNIYNTDCEYNALLFGRWKPPSFDMSDGDSVCLVLDYSFYDDIEAVGDADPDGPVDAVNPSSRVAIRNIIFCETTVPSGANRRAVAWSIRNVEYKERYTVVCLRKENFTIYDSTGAIVNWGDADGFDFSSVALMDVRIAMQNTAADNASGNPINIKILSLWTYDSTVLVDRIPVVLSFDDQFESMYTYLNEFTSRNIPITHCITENNWGPGGGKFTQAQAQEMYEAGHDFVNHGTSHKNNDDETAAAMLADHVAGWDSMVARGVRPNSVKVGAYPFGKCDEEYNDLLEADGYVFMRGTARGHPGIADTSTPPKLNAQRGHPILFGELVNRWEKISIPMDGTDAELDTAALHLSYLDISRSQGQASFHHGHGFQNGGTVTDSLYWLLSELQDFLDGLVDRMTPGFDSYLPVEVVTLSRGSGSYLASMGVQGLSEIADRLFPPVITSPVKSSIIYDITKTP